MMGPRRQGHLKRQQDLQKQQVDQGWAGRFPRRSSCSMPVRVAAGMLGLTTRQELLAALLVAVRLSPRP